MELKKAVAGLLLDVAKDPGNKDLRLYLADALEDLIDSTHAQYRLINKLRSEHGRWRVKLMRLHFDSVWQQEWRFYWEAAERSRAAGIVYNYSLDGLLGICLNHPDPRLITCSNNKCSEWVTIFQASQGLGWRWHCEYCGTSWV